MGMGPFCRRRLSASGGSFRLGSLPGTSTATARATWPWRTICNNVGVLLGNGNGTFRGSNVQLRRLMPSCVAMGDFNADGMSDLAVANSPQQRRCAYEHYGTATPGSDYIGVTAPDDRSRPDQRNDRGPDHRRYDLRADETFSLTLGTPTGAAAAPARARADH